MIFDDDAQVSISALCCLDEVLQEAGGLSLDEKLVTFFLFERLPSLNEWGQCLLLEKLARYTPSSENATLQYLNCLDDRLKHSNKAVVMAAINLFLKYTKKLDHIKNDVYERIRTPILTLLQTSTAELQLSILHHIAVLTQLKPRLFSRDYKHFYLKFNEPVYVKLKKLEILTQVLTEGNYQSIIDEMKEYIHHSEKELSFYCLKLLAKIALDHAFTVDVIVRTLLEVFRLEVDYLTSSLMVVFQELISRYESISHVILPEISDCWSCVKDDAPARAALIWIYGEYGEHIERAPYDLEQLLDNIANEYSDEVKLAMLTATIKLFFKRPPECQELIGRLLKHCIDTEKNMCVRDKALFYYRLLQNVNEAKTVLLSKDASNPTPVHHGLLQTIQDSDFRFTEFNSMSLMHNQPSTSFCHLYDSWRHAPLREDTDLPKTVKEATDIVIEKILDIDGNTEQNSFKLEEVKLDQDFQMEKSEFQTFWKTAIHSDRFEETIMTNISQNEVTELAMKAGFKLLATSRPNDPKIRLLMYAKLATKEDVAVIEFVVQNEIKKISILVKAGTDETIVELLSYLKDTLVKDLVISAHET